jgi:2,3-dihydroxybenzoate decarboxylase
MRKITLEEHFTAPDFTQTARGQQVQRSASASDVANRPAEIQARLADLGERRLAEMDAAGINVQVLSQSSPGVQAETDPAKAIWVARRTNDYLAEHIRKHPDRYAGFAALPLQNPAAAADELERTVTQMGFKGAMVNGHTHGAYLDEPKFRVVWERAAALGVPIYLHPANPPADQMKIYEGHPGLLGATWNWTVETATHALRIICGGVFDAFPNATLLLGHMGEALPFELRRLDDGWSRTSQSKQLQKPLSYYIKHNIMITTSGNLSMEALLCSLLTLGADRILFSVDYPFWMPQMAVQFMETAPLSDEDKEKIFHLNAERLLKL